MRTSKKTAAPKSWNDWKRNVDAAMRIKFGDVSDFYPEVEEKQDAWDATRRTWNSFIAEAIVAASKETVSVASAYKRCVEYLRRASQIDPATHDVASALGITL